MTLLSTPATESWLAAVADAQQRIRDSADDPAALLDTLVAIASALIDASARVALTVDDHLVWHATSRDNPAPIGHPVPTEGTLCGRAWRTGTLQRDRGDQPPAATACCGGAYASAISVPLVHGMGVLGVLALGSAEPAWFDRSDEHAALLLASTAAAALAAYLDAQAPADGPAAATDDMPDATDDVEIWLDDAEADPWAEPDESEEEPEPEGEVSHQPASAVVDVLTPAAPLTFPLDPAAAVPAPSGMGLWEWDARTGACIWSAPVARLLGIPAGAAVRLSDIRDAVQDSDRARFDLAVRAVRSGRSVGGALRVTAADGSTRHVYAWSEVRRGDDGTLHGAWGAVVDVTEFERDAAALRSSIAGLRAAQELTGLGVWEWYPDSGRLVWSPEMYRLAGLEPGSIEPTLEQWHRLVHPDDVERAQRLDVGALAAGEQHERVETFRVIGPGGELRHVQSWSSLTSATGMLGVGDGPRAVYGATIDVTRQVSDRVMLERLSTTDHVTGLENRLAFDHRIQEMLSRPPRPDRQVCLLLLDLDRFKSVNDALGHQIGDRLLIEVARRLLAVVPPEAMTARMGGDEFVVVPPAGTPEREVRALAGTIVEALRAPYVLPDSGEMLVCPASIGVAATGSRRVSAHDLLREADIALYRAKDAGRDRYVIFDDALRTRTQLRQRAERRLRDAIDEGRLALQYQPVIDFTHGRIVGAEALIRIADAEDGRLLPPDFFIDVAEDTGLVVELDCWVIEEGIAQIARWGERPGPSGEPPWLAINVSPRSMEHPRVTRRLVDAVKRGHLPRNRIKIELTERSFIGALPGAEDALRRLIAAGVPIGIDDFGTGYSALAYLPRFDLDFMKIDRSFVADVGRAPRADSVVMAIVDLAHAHGMRVTAEGVETPRQARTLREIGCDFAQGYHFGRPTEARRILRP